MKKNKIISVICVLTVILSAVLIPYGANAVSVEEPAVANLHNVTESVSDGETVYKVLSWKANSVTFDYKIESGYIYCISFEYKGTNRFDIESEGQALKASTVKEKSNYLNDAAENAVTIKLSDYADDYRSVWCEISGEALLKSGGTYLTLNWKHLLEDSFFRNFKIVKLLKSEERPAVSLLHNSSAYVENGEIIYSGSAWNAGSITFDYEIESGYMYYVCFDYKGHNWAQRQTVMASTVNSIESSLNDPAASALSLNVPANSRESFKSVALQLNGSDLLKSGGKYLAFNWVEMGDPLYFKNIKVYKMPNDGYEHPVTKSENVTVEMSDEGAFYAFCGDGNSAELRFDFKLEKGKTYAVNFDYIFGGSKSCEIGFKTSQNPISKSSDADIGVSLEKPEATESIRNMTATFTADDIVKASNEYLVFNIKGLKSGEYFKAANFTVGEINPDALLPNGGFEAGKIYWEDNDNCSEASSDAFGGNVSLRLNGGCYSTVSSSVRLKTESVYKLSFKYKGNFTGIPNCCISRSKTLDDTNGLVGYSVLENTTEWKEASISFSTGVYTDFYIIFQSSLGCDFCIDDAVIEESSELSEVAYSSNAPEYTVTETDNRFRHWDAVSEEENLVLNGSFDGEGGNWSSLLENGTITLYTGEGAHSGNKMLKFEAAGLSENSRNYLYLACEPDTEYLLSVWHRGELRSDTNKNDMRWGIADPINGNLINTSQYLKGYNLSCWDNEWHRTTLKFNSGSNTVIALAYMGADSTAYIDDLQIFKYSDRKDARPEVMIAKRPDITENSPENTFCDNENNLFENFDFEDADTSFWSGTDSIGYKGTVSEKYTTVLDWDGTAEIVDTHSSHGKALYYTVNDQYTGYPLSTSYIKYIDVEPNTEYTFAADFCIEKVGGGRFALVAVNSFYPRQIAAWQSFSEESFDSNYNWQTVAYSFNSNEYTRVAFVLQDKGGAAYIDNIRLFKTADGKPHNETEVIRKIKSEKYEIENGFIKFEELCVSVKEVIGSFNVNDGIRAFDRDGNEITDMSTAVAPGMQFRYMDGLTVFDIVTAEIGGDINCDGYVDIRDSVRLKKIILGIFVADKSKCDLNHDSNIDAIDLVLLKKRLMFG